MKARGPHIPRRRVPAARAGFTLTELLVVVSILGLLAAILMPSLHQAITVAQEKAACTSNIAAIAKACGFYAHADRKKRLPSIFDKLNWGADWGDMEKGNPACLWLLIEGKQCSRSAFLCLGAQSVRGWEEAKLDANRFAYDPEDDVSTLSYSYISMVGKSNWPERLHEKMAYDMVPATLIILADQNPRCTPGSTKLFPFEDLDHNGSTANDRKEVLSLRDRAKNSANHRRKGQNMARIDGSVAWKEDPNDINEDDIYSAGEGVSASDEKLGCRKDELDAFVIP